MAEVGLGEAVDDVVTGEPLREVGDVRLRKLGVGVGRGGRRWRGEVVVGGGVGRKDEHRVLVRFETTVEVVESAFLGVGEGFL